MTEFEILKQQKDAIIESEREKRIDELTQEAYSSSERRWIPRYPWVFVRVTSKEQRTNSGLILPATDQNKTVHEGIVLATWRPFKVIRKCRPSVEVRARMDDLGVTGWLEYCHMEEERVSGMKPGDHVLFQHWAGLPVTGFSANRYRIVRECDWNESNQGGIFATVEYKAGETHSNRLRELLASMGTHMGGLGAALGGLDEAVKRIEEEFLLVDRRGESVTLSGW